MARRLHNSGHFLNVPSGDVTERSHPRFPLFDDAAHRGIVDAEIAGDLLQAIVAVSVGGGDAKIPLLPGKIIGQRFGQRATLGAGNLRIGRLLR